MGWSRGHSGRGFLLRNGVIKTWDLDPYHPVDQADRHQLDHEVSPITLQFDIDPDGGIVTAKPSPQVEQVLLADPRLYDAGQRPVFEDDWDLAHFEPTVDPVGKPDFNFIMSAAHRATHINRWTGRPCSCPWHGSQRGHHGRLSSVHLAGQELNKLLKAPDKKFKTPEGQAFLEHIKQGAVPEEYESLLPYLAQRWKRGEIKLGEPDMASHSGLWRERASGPGGAAPPWNPALPYSHHTPLENDLPGWHQWTEARNHPLRRGVNYMDPAFTVHDMAAKAQAHQEDLQAQEMLKGGLSKGEVVHTFPGRPAGGIDWDRAFSDVDDDYYNQLPWTREDVQNWRENEGYPESPVGMGSPPPEFLDEYDLPARKSGWHIRHLNPGAGGYGSGMNADDIRDAMEAEGEVMNHCIGTDEQPYKQNAMDGDINVYSLRDPKGFPHATWHYNPDGSLAEKFGRSDDELKPEYQDMLDEWGQKTKHDVGRGEGHNVQNHDESFTFPGPTTVDAYNAMRDGDIDWDYAHENGDIGDDTEFDYEAPDWGQIADDYLRYHDPRAAVRMYEHFREDHYGEEDMADALREAVDPENADHRSIASMWNENARANNGLDVPPTNANEVDKYNETFDEGERPEPNDWNHLAQDYLNYSEHYGPTPSQNIYNPTNRWLPNQTEYQKFHANLAENRYHTGHPEAMQVALQNNINWNDPSHVNGAYHWHNAFPELPLERPVPGPPQQLPGQQQMPGNWLPQHWGPDQHMYDGPNYSSWRSAASDEMHVGLSIPAKIVKEIRAWVDDQDWPEGTELEDASDYHITMLYSHDGYEEHHDADWLTHSKGYEVAVTGVDEFNADDQDAAIVLRLTSPEAVKGGEAMHDDAEDHGLDVSRFPGGYKPHITVAYGPGKPKRCTAPKLKFKTGPSQVSEPRESSWHLADDYDYRMQHTAPGPDEIPFHDLSAGSGLSDFYEHPEWYSYNPEFDPDSLRAVQQARGNPNALVTIHRAGPTNQINTGDWVTPSHAYAKQHGMHHSDPNLDEKVWSAQVPAHTLWWDGNDLNEYGYHGPSLEGKRFYRTRSNPEFRDMSQELGTSSVNDPEHTLSPAVELREWLGDLGGEEPAAPSIHHQDQSDFIQAPEASTSMALPYFPPANIPKEYKQSSDSTMTWEPGTWGKGLMTPDYSQMSGPPQPGDPIPQTLHTWPTDFSGKPHHIDKTRQLYPNGGYQTSNPITISPDGWYTSEIPNDNITDFARAHPALKYIADEDKWQRRAFASRQNADGRSDLARDSMTRSLYHGTLRDNLGTIKSLGLRPDVGGFTRDGYDLDEDGNYDQGDEALYSMDELGIRPAVFMTDKQRLNKALTAIRHNVAQKLGIGFHDVTPQHVRNHGLLIKQPGEMGWSDDPRSDNHLQHPYVLDDGHDPEQWEDDPDWLERNRYEEHPYQAEPGDFYSEGQVGPKGLQYIQGPAMMRVFQRQLGWPEQPQNPPIDPQQAIAKTAAMTRAQMLAKAEYLDRTYGPDGSSIEHMWPDGWSVRGLCTYGDMHREGQLMGNCMSPVDEYDQAQWAHPEWDHYYGLQHPSEEEGGEGGDMRDREYSLTPKELAQEVGSDLYSLRDPDNLPHVSYDPNEADPSKQALGRHNAPPKPEYLARLHDFNEGASGLTDQSQWTAATKTADAPQVSYHLTDNPNFALDPTYAPANNTTLGGDYKPGLFMAEDANDWFSHPQYHYMQPFVAEVEHPPLDRLGGYGREKFLPADMFPQSRVRRVMPFDQYIREQYGAPGPIETYHDHADVPYNDQPKYPDYRYEGPDVREMSPEEVARHKERTTQYFRSQHPEAFSAGARCPKCRDHQTVHTWDPNSFYCQSCGGTFPFPEEDEDDEHWSSTKAADTGPYNGQDGDPPGIVPSDQAPAPEGAGDAGPPGFPTIGALADLNRGIHDAAGQPERFQLDQPSPLASALDRARAVYEPSPEGTLRTAGHLAHGIAQAQGFRDGNRRTAYFAVQNFLANNGMGHASPQHVDDHMLARYLNQVVDNPHAGRPAPGPDEFHDLFQRRHVNRRRVGATRTADSPINQADATNDPLGKNPALVPTRHGDPDYLEEAICPHCLQKHRPDAPCADSSVTQFRQQERDWANRDPNALHGAPDGLSVHQTDLGKMSAMTPNQQARLRQELEARYGPEQTNVIHQFPDGWSIRHLPTWNELGREGEMMHHCWAGMDGDEPYDSSGQMALSLRDANNWPHTSFSYDPSDKTPYGFGEHGGWPLDDESPHQRYLQQWMASIGGNWEHPMKQYEDDYDPSAPVDPYWQYESELPAVSASAIMGSVPVLGQSDVRSTDAQRVAALRTKYADRLDQPGHQLWFKPVRLGPNGQYPRNFDHGRGLIHDPSGTVHTWPEAEGTHAEMMNAKGLADQDCTRFYLNPEGVVNQIHGPSQSFMTIMNASPALARANGMA